MTKYRVVVTQDVSEKKELEVEGSRAEVNKTGDLLIFEDGIIGNCLGTTRMVISVSRGHWISVEGR